MEERVITKIIRGGAWLYANSIVNNVFGFLYWLTISKIGSAEILGITSAVISLSTLVSSILDLGISSSSLKLLGESVRDPKAFSKFLWSATLYTVISRGFAALALFILGLAGVSIAGFAPRMLEISAILIALGAASYLSTVLIVIVDTKRLFIANTVGNAAKLALGILLVSMGLGWVGASLVYGVVPIALGIAGLLRVLNMGMRPELSIATGYVLRLIRVGIAAWLPGILVLLSQRLAVLTLFGARGAIETGSFYLASTIAGFVTGFAGAMATLLLPVISSMSSDREEVSTRVARVSLCIVAPVTMFIATYPDLLLKLFGRTYLGASPALTVLSIAMLLQVSCATLANLIYSYEMLRTVLIAGFFQAIPRVVLYLVLAPPLGGFGIAIAYLVGTVASLAYLTNFSIKMKLVGRGFPKSIAEVVTVPSAIALALHLLRAPPIIGALVMCSSYAIYTRIRVLSRSEVRTVLEAITSREAVHRIYKVLRPLVELIFPD